MTTCFIVYGKGGTVGITSCFASELEHTDDELKVRDTAMWHEFRIHKRRHIAYSSKFPADKYVLSEAVTSS